MSYPLLFLRLPLLRLRLHHHHRIAAGTVARRPWCSAADPCRREEEAAVSREGPARYPQQKCEDRKWRGKEKEILEDIEPITLLAKEIIHSDRYLDGERLTRADESTVLEKLLAYHPNSEDKIGCGFDSIMVDRHPQFKQSRCMFVIRTDGGWIDFSYQKCLREYIKRKYPTHAEKFIKKNFKRGSS